jgi:hypothetical protein
VQKRVIGLKNLTIEVPDDDPDDVGIHEAPDLRLPFAQCLFGEFALGDTSALAFTQPISISARGRMRVNLRALATRLAMTNRSMGRSSTTRHAPWSDFLDKTVGRANLMGSYTLIWRSFTPAIF